MKMKKCWHHYITLFVQPGGSRIAATSKMEPFVIIVNGYQPLTIITKCSLLDFVAVLDPPLHLIKMTKDIGFRPFL